MPETEPWVWACAVKGGIHQNDAGDLMAREQVMDLFGVKAGRRRRFGKERGQKIGAGGCVFIEDQAGALCFGEDGEGAGTGAGFEDDIGGGDSGGESGDIAKLYGR